MSLTGMPQRHEPLDKHPTCKHVPWALPVLLESGTCCWAKAEMLALGLAALLASCETPDAPYITVARALSRYAWYSLHRLGSYAACVSHDVRPYFG